MVHFVVRASFAGALFDGAIAKWYGTGLQNPERRFESGWRLEMTPRPRLPGAAFLRFSVSILAQPVSAGPVPAGIRATTECP